jgi:hypothetical protein
VFHAVTVPRPVRVRSTACGATTVVWTGSAADAGAPECEVSSLLRAAASQGVPPATRARPRTTKPARSRHRGACPASSVLIVNMGAHRVREWEGQILRVVVEACHPRGGAPRDMRQWPLGSPAFAAMQHCASERLGRSLAIICFSLLSLLPWSKEVGRPAPRH